MNTEPVPVAGVLEPPRRRWWRDLILGGVVFACGFLLGGVVVGRVVSMRTVEQRMEGVDLQAALTRLRHNLNLDAEQARQVEAVIGRGLKELRGMRQTFRPQVESVLRQIREDVAAHLDDRQKALWNRRFDTMRRRWLSALSGRWGGERREGGPQDKGGRRPHTGDMGVGPGTE